MRKIQVDYEPSYEKQDTVVSNALITQLMVNITKIGMRVDSPQNTDAIIKKEKRNDQKFSH